MEKEKNNKSDTVEKRGDTLLVLHHSSDSIGLVRGIDQQGNLKEIQPGDKNSEEFVRIEPGEDSFSRFFADFYRKLKDPSEFSFFKVTEYEAVKTANDLQQYVKHASSEERNKLREYKISIDRVDAAGNQPLRNIENDQGQRLSYRYEASQVDWNVLGKIGLTRDMLEQMNALDPLLRGFKTPGLIPVRMNLGTGMMTIQARLSLRETFSGGVGAYLHGVRKEPDLHSAFLGHEFTEEDKKNLLETGNMGRVVDLVYPVTGDRIPSVISRDRLTNELTAYRAEYIRIPDEIKGVRLSQEQKHILRQGKPLYLENMLSGRGTLFNADKRYVEFLFKKNIRSLCVGDLKSGIKEGVPEFFRGRKLKVWQMEKLKAGETAYIDGLVDRNGKKYQGYIRFDKDRGKFEFSFKNVWNKEEGLKRISGKSKGRKM
ncbi:DUF3945 domain-containing protein [Chryseobacterium lathyri]|uniref:DUF3945 domain-containing protein n=1 Tax=Chryseobacterium lathyri TaxID=395933 RepID=A0ABT9SI87_9FLAO|nr:DUF3945 domain-containing protein [Chryseobacterium lathyri]MDP9959152.1 hypothetical protein [Chryseobacterium lathyri]